MIQTSDERRPLDTNGAQVMASRPVPSLPAAPEIKRATLAQMYRHCENWPQEQRVELIVRPREPLTLDLDVVRGIRPDILIRVSCLDEDTRRLWQRAVNYGTTHALWPGVNVRGNDRP